MSQPFARANAMFALIAAAMATANPQAALAKIGPYVSRGKGTGKRHGSSRCVAMDKRAASKARNQARHKKHCK
jgi:hypothetical protein